MGYTRFNCRSTSTSMVIDAKHAKDAAQEFVDEMMHNLYKVKLKKCSAMEMRKFPDTTITVTKADGSGKEEYFQYTSMIPKY
ncbi:hypothetical protein SAMN04487934_11144 [Eubacterium ruminantium]|nr:hypothetical protein SAMN04487934_11144 [Eubacterium ruminantium]